MSPMIFFYRVFLTIKLLYQHTAGREKKETDRSGVAEYGNSSAVIVSVCNCHEIYDDIKYVNVQFLGSKFIFKWTENT